jgi:hypothetical protein
VTLLLQVIDVAHVKADQLRTYIRDREAEATQGTPTHKAGRLLILLDQALKGSREAVEELKRLQQETLTTVAVAT